MGVFPRKPKKQAWPNQRQRMLEAPIPPLIGTLAVPTIASMLITSIYNMADTYFVSQINTSASGAVGIVFSIMSIIQAVGFTVGVGSGSLASRLLGQGRREDADVYASSAVVSALALGLLLTALGLLWLGPLIWALGSTPTIYPYAVAYARCILLGAPVMVLSFTLNNLLRWQGRANLSVIGLTTGGILNIFLDPLFIWLFHGIAGAGIATLLSQCVSLSILASFFLTGRSELHLSPASISRSPNVYLAIFKQGMPSFFRQGVLSVSNMALNFNARVYGDAAVAAMSIVGKVFMVVQSITIGFGQGFQPVLGYNYGANRLDRVREAVLFSLKTCTAILTIAAVIGFFSADQIVACFRRDDLAVIDIGSRAFRMQCFTLPLAPMLTFANMLFQSLGKSWRATILAVCRQGLYIPIVFLLSWRFQLQGLVVAQASADLLAFLISAGITAHFFLTEFGKTP